ncbi:MAG: NAD(P)/FAD-dependent oxidoreductase [Gemmatimonadota bacterium]
MNSGWTVLVLGGGVGGIVAARSLRRRLSDRDRVVLIDRERRHAFAPSFLWLAVGEREPRAITRPLDRLERHGIEVVAGEIEAIDPERKAVRVDGEELVGDAVVVSLGAALEPDAVPGLAEGGHDLYTLAGADRIRRELERFRSGRVVVLTADPVYKCPAAPYEAAMLIHDRLRRRGLEGSAPVAVYAAEPGPMGTAGPDVSAAVRTMVEERGIEYHPEHRIEVVDAEARRLHFADGASTEYDLLVYVPPHRAPDVVRQSGLTDESGWVPVDPHTLATEATGVYAIGDVTTIPIPSGKRLPKAGVFAHGQAEIVARNLAAELRGGTPNAAFDGKGACFIETGGGRAGYGSGDFYASPAPRMRLRSPARWWHWGKVLFEKRWLRRWF